MPDNTPTITEIEGRNIDPELGSGNPAVVYDDRQLLNILNQNAQFKAANDWRKYQQFLGDYEAKLKTQQDIADLAVADSDREWLKKESVSLFKDALSDPYKIYSPEFNSKLANIKANATSSKQARDFAEKNAQWIAIHPEFNTEENKAKIADFIDGQTVETGGRKFFTLDAPDVFDYIGFTGDLKKDPSVMQTINESRVSPDKSLIYERQDTKYLRDPYLRLSEVSYDTNPKVKRYAQKLFDGLSDAQKRKIGDPKALWLQLSGKAFGSDTDILQQGKEQIQPNTNYLKPQQLAEQIRANKADEAIKWGELDLKKEANKLKDKSAEAQATWLNNFVNGVVQNAINGKKEIYTGKGGNKKKLDGYEAELSNPTLALFGYETSDGENKKVNIPPDKAVVSPDGKSITFKFYLKEKNRIKKDKAGNDLIDETKTKIVPTEEFKARVGKDLLGVKTLAEEIYPYGGSGATIQTEKPDWAE